jgi:hypothetical protein
MVGRQKTPPAVSTPRIVTVHVDHDTMTIDLGGDDTRTVRRTTTQPVRSWDQTAIILVLGSRGSVFAPAAN